LVSFRLPFVLLLTVIACRDREVGAPPRTARFEETIAHDLGARFGTPATVHCEIVLGVPVQCTAKLADGTELPLALDNANKDEWGWKVKGRVVETKLVVPYVSEALASVHAYQTVDCGRPVQLLPPGDAVVCKLGGGGVALVSFADDGEASVELELDPAAAAARTELVTPDRERELAQQSKALESLGGETDGEEPTPDAGVR
jgi:hypothetical protein